MSSTPLSIKNDRGEDKKAEPIGRLEEKKECDNRQEEKKDKGITVKKH